MAGVASILANHWLRTTSGPQVHSMISAVPSVVGALCPELPSPVSQLAKSMNDQIRATCSLNGENTWFLLTRVAITSVVPISTLTRSDQRRLPRPLAQKLFLSRTVPTLKRLNSREHPVSHGLRAC